MKRMGLTVTLGLAFTACGAPPADDGIYSPLAHPAVRAAHTRIDGASPPSPSGVRGLSTPPDPSICPNFPAGPPIAYNGGYVLANVNVVPVFWGSSVNSTTKSTIPGFLSTIVNSSYMDWLTEYSTTLPVTGFPTIPGRNQIIGRGTATTAVTIAPINKKLSLTDDDIGIELTAQISAGNLPTPVDNTTLYMVYFPKGASVSQANGDVSCASSGDVNCFCGYHSGASAGVHYGVIMDQSVCPLTFKGATQIEATEMDSSHELVEAITDPNLDAWTTTPVVLFENPNCGELVDICNDEAVFLPNSSSALVSAVWSHRTNSCVTNVSIPTAGDPSSYARVEFPPGKPTMTVSAVVYRGPNNDAKELSLNTAGGSTWKLNDLSTAAQPKGPASASSLATYARADGVNSVVYRAASNDIYELQLIAGASAWKTVDLMHVLASPPPAATGDPGAYARSDGYSSVVYVGKDGHVHEIAWKPSTTVSTSLVFGDITMNSGAAANAVGDPFGYIRADGTNAVVYRNSDDHIIELSLNGTAWGWGDLTVLSGNAPAAASRPRGYARSDQVSAVVYQGTDNQIYELSLSPAQTTWRYGNLTAIAGAPATASQPVPFVRTFGSNAVVYRDAKNHIDALTLVEGENWTVSDLTIDSGGAPTATGAPTGYIRPDGFNAVNFHAASNNDIIELNNLGTNWEAGNLTTISGGSL